jgi:dienelactone hydrolase
VRLAKIAVNLFSLTLTLPLLSQDVPVGHWKGLMTHDGADVGIQFDIGENQGHLVGSFTSLQQRVLDYPFDNVVYSAPKLHIDLAGGDTVFDGVLAQGKLEGTFQEQGEGSGTFRLERFTPASLPYSSENVTFRNGDVVLAGSLYIPRTPGEHPVIIFLQGSGPEMRWGANRFWADYFARRGIAALIYDKRGTGESTGDWKKSDFNDLARDAVAGIELVKHRAGVNAGQIGIYGHSQGGSIAPLVAARSGSVAFVISAAGTGVSMLDSEVYGWRTYLEGQGLNGVDLNEAAAFLQRAAQLAVSGDHGWEKWVAAQQTERSRTWYKLVDPPGKDSEWWTSFPKNANYNPAQYWRQVNVPVLVLEAGDDTDVPVGPSVAAIREALSRGGNQDYTVLILPGAPHTFVVHTQPGRPFQWPYLYQGYADLLAAWVRYRTIDRPLPK